MNVLVTGGSGFIGKECAAALKEAGHTVRILARSVAMLQKMQNCGYETAAGDVSNPSTLTNALNGIDAVVHCVGIILEPKGITFESVVVEGTRNLVDACKSAGVKKIVYISALGTRANAVSRYHKTKWQAEEMVRSCGIDFTILRPSVVYGKEDKFLNTFMKMPIMALPGGGKGLFQPTYVKDLAQMTVLSLVTPEASNKTLDAGGPETFTYKDMMQTALKVKGVSRMSVPLPMWFMKILSVVHDPFQRIYLPLALFTKDQYLMMQEDNAGDSSELKRVFPGMKMHVFVDGLGEYLSKVH